MPGVLLAPGILAMTVRSQDHLVPPSQMFLSVRPPLFVLPLLFVVGSVTPRLLIILVPVFLVLEILTLIVRSLGHLVSPPLVSPPEKPPPLALLPLFVIGVHIYGLISVLINQLVGIRCPMTLIPLA